MKNSRKQKTDREEDCHDDEKENKRNKEKYDKEKRRSKVMEKTQYK